MRIASKPHRIVLAVVVALLIVVVTGLTCLVLRLYWASSIPARPRTLPANAIWVPAPPVPFDLERRGDWLSCWVDRQQKVNRCRVSDCGGATKYEGDLLPLSGAGPIPEQRLRLKPVTTTMELWMWSDSAKRDVPIVRLTDGTVLLPANGYEELKRRLERDQNDTAPPS